MAPIPRPLLRKRLELASELALVEKRADELRHQVAMVEGAIGLLDPGWRAPKVRARRLPTHQGRLPVGDVGREGLRALKRAGKSVTTTDLVAAIAGARGLHFASRKDREDFASSVTMAMRRYEKKGAVASAPVNGSHTLAWRLRVE